MTRVNNNVEIKTTEMNNSTNPVIKKLSFWTSRSSIDNCEKGKSNYDDYTYAAGEKVKSNDINLEKLPNRVPKRKTSFAHALPQDHLTSYGETLMHLLKGNIGSGLFAMGDAIKNAGIFLGPPLVLVLGIICVHCQHLLVNVAKQMAKKSDDVTLPDYAETIELTFQHGSIRMQKMTICMRRIVNTFLCVTQLGFCCIYFVFISENIKQVCDYYGYKLDLHFHMAIVVLPILLTALVRNLKYLAPFSTVANIFMLIGIVTTIYYTSIHIHPIEERNYVTDYTKWPLFFGTAIFAFEGIGLVLPLQNEMKNPKNFRKAHGVLNVGMTIVICLYIIIGFLSYLRYGENVKGSVTLNLPEEEILSQCVKIILALGILLTYSLQFYIVIDILWTPIKDSFGPFKFPVFYEMVFRTLLVLVTFILAESIPFLDLFISLVGSVSSSALALFFPALLDLLVQHGEGNLRWYTIVKNSAIILLAFAGCFTGSYTSISAIIYNFKNKY